MYFAYAPSLNISHDGHAFICGIDFASFDGGCAHGLSATSKDSAAEAVDRFFALLAKHYPGMQLIIDRGRAVSPF